MASFIPSTFALIFVLVLLFSFVSADFRKDDLDDSYSKRVGPDTCPNKLEFDAKGNELVIKPDEVELNNQGGCSGGDILLKENIADSTATKYLQSIRNDIGDFLAGNVSADITCSGVTLRRGEQLIFIQPDDDYKIEFKNLFPGSPISPVQNASAEYEVEEDAKYVFLGNRCFYEETRISDRVCFPANAMVESAKLGQISINQLAQHDEIVVDQFGNTEKVLGFTHQDPHVRTTFVKACTQHHGCLVATPGHYVNVFDDNNEQEDASSVLRPMGDILVGMALQHKSGSKAFVVSTEYISGKGVYNPHTSSGQIVVDGFVASCYTKTVEPVMAHALLAPLRSRLVLAFSACWSLVKDVAALVQ